MNKKAKYLTESMLRDIGACKYGIDFAKRNNLLPFPISQIKNRKDIKNDYIGFNGWLRENILNADELLVDEDGKLTRYVNKDIIIMIDYGIDTKTVERISIYDTIKIYSRKVINQKNNSSVEHIKAEYEDHVDFSVVEQKNNDEYTILLETCIGGDGLEDYDNSLLTVTNNKYNIRTLKKTANCGGIILKEDEIEHKFIIDINNKEIFDAIDCDNIIKSLKNISTEYTTKDYTNVKLKEDIKLIQEKNFINTESINRFFFENKRTKLRSFNRNKCKQDQVSLEASYNSTGDVTYVEIHDENYNTCIFILDYDINGNLIKHTKISKLLKTTITVVDEWKSDIYSNGQLKQYDELKLPKIER